MEFDTRVILTSPKEGFLYIFNNPIFHLPGFNIRGTGLRGMTYLIGNTIADVKISTNENAKKADSKHNRHSKKRNQTDEGEQTEMDI